MADIPGDLTTTVAMDMSSGVGTFSDQLETIGDHDFIKITLFQNVTTRFYLSFLNTGSVSLGDSTIRLLNSAGTQVASNNDSGVGLNSLMTFTPGVGQGGTFFIDVGETGNNNTGSYSLVASFPFTSPTDRLLDDTNNIFTGTTANERILGGKGADTITIGSGVDAFGEQGNDIIFGNSASQNIISGGLGADTIVGGIFGTDFLFGDSGDDVITGGSEEDTIRGGAGDDIIDASTSADVIEGGGGTDFINGGTGSDAIKGGAGQDFLDGDHAGTDEDIYVYTATSESARGGANRDVIDGFADGFFVHPDHIDVDAIDANTGTSGDQDFAFIGQTAFSHTAGELRFFIDTANNITLVQADVDGNGRADIEIELTGQKTLIAANFDL